MSFNPHIRRKNTILAHITRHFPDTRNPKPFLNRKMTAKNVLGPIQIFAYKLTKLKYIPPALPLSYLFQSLLRLLLPFPAILN